MSLTKALNKRYNGYQALFLLHTARKASHKIVLPNDGKVRPQLKSEFLYYVWDKHPELITDEGKILASADIDGLLEKFNKLSYDKKRAYTNMLNAEEERKKIFEEFVEGTAEKTVEKDAQGAKDTLSNRDAKKRNEGVITSTVKKVCEYVFRKPGAHEFGGEPGYSGTVKKLAKQHPPSTNDFVCYLWKNHPELVTAEGKILAWADVDRLHGAFTKLEFNKKHNYWKIANNERERRHIMEKLVEKPGGTPGPSNCVGHSELLRENIALREENAMLRTEQENLKLKLKDESAPSS